MLISELINYSLPVLKPTDFVGQALNLMQDNRIEAFVVADGEEYLGIATEDKLQDFDEADEIMDLNLQFQEIYLFENQHIYEALSLISKYNLQVISVLNSTKKFVGTITANEIYNKFSELLGSQEIGAVLVIRLKNNDYSLAEISRLIESDNAKIISSYFSGNNFDEENPARLTLKLNRTNISSIVATLERFGYVVESAFANEPVESLEQERYDMLMKYLSI